MRLITKVKSAFSVVELLITIMVLAALAAFTVPTYQLILSQIQLNSAVEEIADFVRLAEQKTVTEQQIYGVQLSNNAVTIPMVLVSGSNRTTIKTLVLPANMKLTDLSLAGQTEVRFSTSGAPSTAGSFEVLDMIRGKSRLIEIRPSGSIRTNSGEVNN